MDSNHEDTSHWQLQGSHSGVSLPLRTGGFNYVLEVEISMNVPELPGVPNFMVQTSAAWVFNKVLPATMAKAQTKHSVLGLVIQYVHYGNKPKDSSISKIRCKAVQKYLL